MNRTTFRVVTAGANGTKKHAERSACFFITSAKGRTRTADRTIFSRELYQLSYLGKSAGSSPGHDGEWAIEGSNL